MEKKFMEMTPKQAVVLSLSKGKIRSTKSETISKSKSSNALNIFWGLVIGESGLSFDLPQFHAEDFEQVLVRVGGRRSPSVRACEQSVCDVVPDGAWGGVIGGHGAGWSHADGVEEGACDG